MFKGLIIKRTLEKLTDGDTGSTLIGLLASTLLATDIKWSDLFSHDDNKKANAIGTIVGAIIIVIWGYFVGKKKPVK